LALVITVSLAACGSDAPAKDAVVKKLKADEDFAKASGAQLDCVAGVIIKYVPAADVKKFVDGGSDLPEPKDKSAAEAEITKCGSAKQ
jgi:hypothetical protein